MTLRARIAAFHSQAPADLEDMMWDLRREAIKGSPEERAAFNNGLLTAAAAVDHYAQGVRDDRLRKAIVPLIGCHGLPSPKGAST